MLSDRMTTRLRYICSHVVFTASRLRVEAV
jgi:hypothetical protein